VGAFAAIFSMNLAAKLLIGSKKKLGWCNDGMEVLYHCAKLGGNRTTHVCVRKQWVMFFTLYVFVCHGLSQPISGASDVHALLQQSVFVGRFICDLHSFFSGTKRSFSGWSRFENRR